MSKPTKTKNRRRSLRNPALNLEALEDRQLLSALSSSQQAAPGPGGGSVYREMDTTRYQPADSQDSSSQIPGETLSSGNSYEKDDSAYAMSDSRASYGNQSYGQTGDGYKAAASAQVGLTSLASISGVVFQVQPIARQHQAQPIPVPVFTATVASAAPEETRPVAAVGPVGTGNAVQVLPPQQPHPTVEELETPWLHALAATPAEVPNQVLLVKQEVVADVPMKTLLAGLSSLDRAMLERTVDTFFNQLNQLGEDFAENGLGSRLAPWLTGAAVATTAYAVARYKLQQIEGDRDGRDQEWAWFTACALLPPDDKP
jgi:hypothetical protein